MNWFLCMILIIFIVLSQLINIYLVSANRYNEGFNSYPEFIQPYINRVTAELAVFMEAKRRHDEANQQLINNYNSQVRQYHSNYAVYTNLKNIFNAKLDNWHRCRKKPAKKFFGSCGGRPNDPNPPTYPSYPSITPYVFPPEVAPKMKDITDIENIIKTAKNINTVSSIESMKNAVTVLNDIINGVNKPFVKGVGICVGTENAFKPFFNEDDNKVNLFRIYNFIHSYETNVLNITEKDTMKTYEMILYIVNKCKIFKTMYMPEGGAWLDIALEFDNNATAMITSIKTSLTELIKIYYNN